MKATQVKAESDYRIKVTFDDGVTGVISLGSMVEKGIFTQLKDVAAFRKVTTDGYSISWSDELEIDAGNIYAELTKSDPATVLHTPTFHAAD